MSLKAVEEQFFFIFLFDVAMATAAIAFRNVRHHRIPSGLRPALIKSSVLIIISAEFRLLQPARLRWKFFRPLDRPQESKREGEIERERETTGSDS